MNRIQTHNFSVNNDETLINFGHSIEIPPLLAICMFDHYLIYYINSNEVY
jgi:hypothetical protein